MKSRIAAERLRDLQSVTDAALAYLPLEDLLNELLRRVVGILDADTAAILLLDEFCRRGRRTTTPRCYSFAHCR